MRPGGRKFGPNGQMDQMANPPSPFLAESPILEEEKGGESWELGKIAPGSSPPSISFGCRCYYRHRRLGGEMKGRAHFKSFKPLGKERS